MSFLDLSAAPGTQMAIVLARFNKAGSCLYSQMDEEAEKSATTPFCPSLFLKQVSVYP